ncbi:hypothetical protein [Roseivivax isoporae]|uniref:hypothetical protein n=1 Tax=Roseivivax isoporae TaxID=591206 RepID=UPI0012ECAC0C|nr:hypothetical protein [Roseivivax isoporae]
MPAAAPTEAQIARAIRAARREGCTSVELWGGALKIRLKDDEPLPQNEAKRQPEPRRWGETG